MEALFAAIRQAASMLSKLFSAGEKYASAIDHIGTVCDESAAAFADEARYKRAANLAVMRKEFDINLEARDAAVETVKAKRVKAIAA